MREFVFDVTLLASLKVEARTEEEALAILTATPFNAMLRVTQDGAKHPKIAETNFDIEGEPDFIEMVTNEIDFDPENIYDDPGIRQSIEEDRK